MAKQKKNQAFGQPFFKTPKRKVIQRHEFLNGKLKVYYAPGQNPDVGEPNNYTTPSTHWQPPNRILYRPQTGWLYLNSLLPYDTKFAHSQYLDYNLTDIAIYNFGTGLHGQAPISTSAGSWVYTGHYFANGGIQVTGAWNDPNPMHTPHEPPGNDIGPWVQFQTDPSPAWSQEIISKSYHGTLPNPHPAERQRLRDIYDETKKIIEKLRPDRTYVQVIDPWVYDAITDTYPRDPPPNGHNPFWGVRDIYFLVRQADLDPDPPYFGQPKIEDYLDWQGMVPSDIDDYFGVNFLQVYAYASSNILTGQGHYGQINFKRPDIIQQALQKFCNYKIIVFGMGQDLKLDDLPPYTAAPVGEPPTTMIFPATGPKPDWKIYSPSDWHPLVDNYGDVWTPNAFDIPAFITQIVKNNNAQINGTNISHQVTVNLNNQLLQTTNNDFISVGGEAEYIGETNLIENASYLVKLIAKHYGFNPDTGKDLPINKNKVKSIIDK